MLWLIGRRRCERKTPEHRALAAIACECARLALPHVPPDEMHPLRAIEAAERYARGEAISREELHAAAADAARASTRVQCADIVRRHWPTSPI